MRVERLEYQDRAANWLLSATDFYSDLTLFVGHGEADKRQILAAIETLSRFALGQAPDELGGVAWQIRFSTEAGRYDWHGELSGKGFSLHDGWRKASLLKLLLPRQLHRGLDPVVLHETLSLNGRALVERKGETVRFNGRLGGECRSSNSAISQLRGEADVQSAFEGFMPRRVRKATDITSAADPRGDAVK